MIPSFSLLSLSPNYDWCSLYPVAFATTTFNLEKRNRAGALERIRDYEQVLFALALLLVRGCPGFGISGNRTGQLAIITRRANTHIALLENREWSSIERVFLFS